MSDFFMLKKVISFVCFSDFRWLFCVIDQKYQLLSKKILFCKK